MIQLMIQILLVNLLAGSRNASWYWNQGSPAEDIGWMKGRNTFYVLLGLTIGTIAFMRSLAVLDEGFVLLFVASLACMIGSLMSNYLLQRAFRYGEGTKVHLYQMLLTSFFMLSLFFSSNPIGLLVISSLVGNTICFNPIIQYVSFGKFFSSKEVTDAKDGSYYGLYLGSRFIKVPRISNFFLKLTIYTILCILYILFLHKYDVTLVDIYEILKTKL